MQASRIFDPWPYPYDRWFETPIGELIKSYESKLVLDLLRPSDGDRILDAGCGTGIFTRDIIAAGSTVTGLDVSFPMLIRTADKFSGRSIFLVQGDMRGLPFRDEVFDKSVSVTAIEFIQEARRAVDELFRVTRPGGLIVVATLNRLSPWAQRRSQAGKEGHSLFQNAVFRSPTDMRRLSKEPAVIQTAIHFQKEDDPETAKTIESEGNSRGLDTGAFLACCWRKL